MDHQENRLRYFLRTNGSSVLKRVENNYDLQLFTEKEIENITNGYKTVLGKGAFGMVYSRTLTDKRPVAIKRYIHGMRKAEFAKEVIVHSQINHKNVVRLFGCCTEENALMLVMEYISNGSLHDNLHCNNVDGRVPFPLDVRLHIAIGSAEVLSCMHSMYRPMLHGDIKPANILLDENFMPKLSDFGIATLLSANEIERTEVVIGCKGYVDPMFRKSGILTLKSDVYSFGVVLLEIFTRKKAVDGNTILAENFTKALTKGKKMRQMFDEEIANAKNMKLLADIGELASECLSMEVNMRPEMVEVADRLRMVRKALQRQQGNVAQGYLFKKSPLNNPISVTKVGPAPRDFGDLKIFTQEEMMNITKNYSMTFREELTEQLYNGILGNYHPVIVKKMSTHSETEKETFQMTMSILSRRKHKNVANIVGFHSEECISECVYESSSEVHHSTNGSIRYYNRNLYDTIRGKKLPLDLRLSIAVQSAEGLVHIHSLLGENPDPYGSEILGHFRSTNIFLDRNMVPKVFNTNLSTLLGVSVEHVYKDVSYFFDPRSKKYYTDPTDVAGMLFDPKPDVYSFGVVLLELITWKTAKYMSDGKVHVLTTDFLEAHRRDSTATEMFDKEDYEEDKLFLQEVSAIAIECLHLDLQKQPEMEDVLTRLQRVATRGGNGAGLGWVQPCFGFGQSQIRI